MARRRHRGRRDASDEDWSDDDEAPGSGTQVVDLHGLNPEAALRRVSQALHAARVRGSADLLVVTGRGLSNRTGDAVLRGKVETWLAGPEARAQGVRGFEREARGGALRLRL